ncbi:MAG: glycosyltransferase family 4 protein [Oscillospiraceae bacterium]|nr:glycosyltransferase family 4 protein [Oscillospiraceae bacterium]
MNVLFISISSMPDVKQHSISLDLLREFQKNGHSISIICALEKNNPKHTYYSEEEGFKIVRVQIGGNKKANIIEKGITTITEPYKYIAAIKKYYSNEKFDLVMYPTPPITQVKTVEFIKKRDGVKSYLLLKDIFPQNAVDIGMMSKFGVKGLLYKYFRRVEKRLYQVSDFIGCMSQANVDYVLKHNPEIKPGKVEVCPNSIEVIDKSVDEKTKVAIRMKYGIPLDKKVFVYGGNLGKPQGIPFIIDCMKECKDIDDACFLIVGDGTEYGKLEEYTKTANQSNLRMMKKLPKEDYDALVAACDVGLIFLDYRFTIPNFPSRLLSYMQAKIPVLACTDPNTDIGKVITEGGFGWWCESNEIKAFYTTVQDILNSRDEVSSEKGFICLCADYSANKNYKIITKHFEEK